MERPFGSLEEALELALNEPKIIIVCQANAFFEPLVISDELPAVRPWRIFGGFDCTSDEGRWTRSETQTVVRPAAGPALRIQGSTGVEIEGFAFRSADAVEFGQSSIAAVVASPAHITFRRVTFDAGKGYRGANGTTAPARLAAAPNGNDASTASGGATQNACTCVESIGGRGGDPGGAVTDDGQPGAPKLDNVGGTGGEGEELSCSIGVAGSNGPDGQPGKGATTLGKVEGLTWVPTAGSLGGHGSTAQGGGGGGGGPAGGGGGGGCGGCGGKAGAPGQGGGASIGLLMIESQVTFFDSHASTTNAGDGGDGQPGQPGQPPGAGGAGTDCRGGPGGPGGDGGPGGSGAGGISVGVVYQGLPPENLEAELGLELGGPGAGGAGDDVTAGSVGISSRSLAL